MANGNGNSACNANDNEAGEFVVSSIRAGMKREFQMMMKAQAECGISLGQRRVTRSQNSPVIKKSPAKNANFKAGDQGLKGFNDRKDAGDKDEVAEEDKAVGVVDARRLVEDGEKKNLVVPEEEETKSDVLDANSDEERKEVKDGVTVEKLIAANTGAEEAPKSAMVALEIGAGNVNNRLAVPLKTYFRRFKKPKVAVTEETKMVVVEKSRTEEGLEASVTEHVADEEVRRRDSLGVSTSASCKLETKMSKKVVLSKIPTKLKELLETGLLEGLHVRYIRGPRVSKPGETGLRGVIKGNGILCFCNDCQGIQTVTPNQFELHAGSGNKRPPEYIYLETGKTLRDVLNACKVASLDSLQLVIQNAIGRSEAKPIFCRECKDQARLNRDMFCDSCIAVRESQQKTSESSDINAGTLVPVSSKSSIGESSGKRPKGHSQGKLTKKDLGLHKLIFQTDYIPDGTPLAYYAQGKQLNTGYKSASGIFCHCCNKVVSPSVFEAHAGCASRRKPYLQIYTPDGRNLHDISVEIKLKSKDSKGPSTDQNDDVCTICEGKGELLCCDLCPRAFHKECVPLASIPNGDWLCRYCSNMMRTRNTGENANAIAAGVERCVRIIGAVEPEVGGCVLCRGHDFSKTEFGPRTVILCDQCEREFHVGCLKDHGMDDLKELPDEKWFCCRECSSIHSSLQQLVSEGEKGLPDHLLSIIKKKHENNGSECQSDLNISWRLFYGKMASDEDRKWLSDAVSVFHECFDPIGGSEKNSRDLIPFMIYGGSNRDQDFGGMYSAILIVNSMVVSAGIFRIFGREIAEIPLVATIRSCQERGYFRALYSCLENFLRSLNVRDLVLPAAHEAESMWMNKFDFVKISEEQLKQYKRDYQMMMFQGTSVLHKTVTGLEAL